MPNHAQITLIGHAGKDPEVRYLTNGDAVASVSLATTRKRKDAEVTSWWKIEGFGKTAEAMQRFITKGQAFGVTGEPVIEEWTDKEGNKRTTAKVYAERIILLGGGALNSVDDGVPQQQNMAQRSTPAPSPRGGGASGFDDMNDDIPFAFNMNAISDIMGASKSLLRAKNGKELLLLQANKAYF